MPVKKHKVQLLDKNFNRIYLVKNANKIDPEKHYVILKGEPLRYDPEDVNFYKDAVFTLGKHVSHGKLLDPEGESYTLDEQLIAIVMKEGITKEVATK